VAGALIGLGMPEFEAKRYEGKVHGGNLLISVHASDDKHLERARKIFEASGADDITTAREASVGKGKSHL
jgi:hypothetical protein